MLFCPTTTVMALRTFGALLGQALVRLGISELHFCYDSSNEHRITHSSWNLDCENGLDDVAPAALR